MKRIGMLAVALVLSAAALLPGSPAEAACTIKICPAGPNCCVHADCYAFCGGPGLGACFHGCCTCVQ